MKEVFCIGYYNSKKESLQKLRNLVNELKLKNKRIMIVGHSSIPQDLIEQCDAYLFDKENPKIVHDTEYISNLTKKTNKINYISFGNYILYSPFFGYLKSEDYCPACIKTAINAFNLAYNLGFEILHFLEYDLIVNEFVLEEFENNYRIINQGEKKCIIYKENNFMFGPYNAHKVDNFISPFEKNYILNKIETNFGSCETTAEKLFEEIYGADNILINQTCEGLSSTVSSVTKKPNFCIYENNDTLNLFIENPNNEIIHNILIYYTGGKIFIDELYTHNYNIYTLDIKEKLFFIHLYVENILIQKIDINNEIDYENFIKVNRLESF